MAAAGDLRDIMDMPHEGTPKSVPKKAQGGPHHRLTGISREVYSLMGDSAPPIPIVESQKYKAKPAYAPRAFKPRQWEERPFTNDARTDKLVLRHWKHSIPPTSSQPIVTSDAIPRTVPTIPNDENPDPNQSLAARHSDEFPMEKFNVSVGVATYTDEQYVKEFKSDDWTKEETDFLMELCRDYDLRWFVVADRYIPEDIPLPPKYVSQPDNINDMAVDTPQNLQKKCPYPERTLEALKSRYYTIAAKLLENHTPANEMTQSEFHLWEKMRNFDANTESMRKRLAEKLFERTKDEAEEEKILLEELHRITRNEEEFLKMRRDLYSRLEPPPTIRRNGEEQSTAMYQTSSGLSALLQTLLAREKKFKRPSMMTSGGTDAPHVSNAIPQSADSENPPKRQGWEKGRHPNQYTRRDTMDTQNDDSGPQKKAAPSQPNVRILNLAEENKYGVSHPQERLTSGVQFRHEKVHKIVQAKSQVQSQKVQAALVELGVPARLVMPTEKVCREFERLVAEIQVLLDARKTSEKVSSEVKILEEARRNRLGLTVEGGNGGREKMDVGEPVAGDFSRAKDAEADDGEDGENVEDREEGEEGEDVDDGDNGDDGEDAEDREDGKSNADQAIDEESEEDEDLDVANEESAIQDDDENEDDGGGEEIEEDEGKDPDMANSPSVGFGSAEGDEDEGEEEEGNDEEEEAEEDEDVDEQEASVDEADDQDEQEEAEPEDSDTQSQKRRLSPAHLVATRLQKRSASVISEGSKAGSNRSGIGRKKRK